MNEMDFNFSNEVAMDIYSARIILLLKDSNQNEEERIGEGTETK